MDCSSSTFSRHALEQMFARNISVEDVAEVLRKGDAIESYPDDKPYPSFLLLGQVRGRMLHVVAARDPGSKGCIVITAYEPSPGIWESGSRIRRKK